MLSTSDLQFFCTVAQAPTLVAAARSLNVTAPAVTRRLQQLEARLQLALIDRSTRKSRLTDEGRMLADKGAVVLRQIEDMSEELHARRETVAGHLRLVAPFGFGRHFVAPLVTQFREQFPNSEVSLRLSESPLQTSDSWDLAVHLGTLRDSNLIAQVLARNERVLCASPAYLERYGVPQHPEELDQHLCGTAMENDEDATSLRFIGPHGAVASIRIDPSVSSNDGGVVRDWGIAGLAMIARSEWDVADDLRAGRLVRVLDEWRLPPADVTVVVNERSRRAARTKKFLEMLRASLSPAPWRSNLQ